MKRPPIIPVFLSLSGTRSSWLIPAVWFSLIVSSQAALMSVAWDSSDTSADGQISGQLGNISVSVNNQSNMDPAARNGGLYFSTDWSTNLGSNNVPGIDGPGITNDAASLDMGGASYQTTTITFSEAVVNPTILINFVDDKSHQWLFDSLMPLLILHDSNQVNPLIQAGNQVFINASEGNNTANSGFAIQLTGSFDSISFDSSNYDYLTPHSVGFTIVAQVPEPATISLLALSSAGLFRRRRS